LPGGSRLSRRLLAASAICALASLPAQAGNQQEEQLAASVRAALHRSVSDAAPAEIPIKDAAERSLWLAEMSHRLAKRVPNLSARRELLTAIHYEATRAGLDAQLVLGLIQVESGFSKYALSKAGARGYMQVMPFWVDTIGSAEDNLFHLRTNLRYGCTILRHYIDLEKGNLFFALGRYNGSRGRPEYPQRIRKAWQNTWAWAPPPAITKIAATASTPPAVPPIPSQAAEQAKPASQPPAVAQRPAKAKKPVDPPAPIAAVAATTPEAPTAAPLSVASPPRAAPHTPVRRDIVIVR
jgi:soluble lytic murein transglycosylase-like protein